MKVYYKIPEFNEPTVVAIGTFDGVHLGHISVLQHAAAIAAQTDRKLIVFTFLDHPSVVTGSRSVPKLLTTSQEKVIKLENFEIDSCIIPEFNKEFSKLSPADFVRQILVEALKAEYVCVGYNFFFGHKAAGNTEILKELSKEHGFEVNVTEPVKYDNEPISSSLIRKNLEEGDLDRANALLGSPYFLKGSVIRGKGIGNKVLGIPTANISINHRKQLPQNGVYACEVVHNGKKYRAVTNIGNRPSFDNGEKSLEVHILDFIEDIYEHSLEVDFISYLRPEIKFDDLEMLKAQIHKDIKACRQL